MAGGVEDLDAVGEEGDGIGGEGGWEAVDGLRGAGLYGEARQRGAERFDIYFVFIPSLKESKVQAPLSFSVSVSWREVREPLMRRRSPFEVIGTNQKRRCKACGIKQQQQKPLPALDLR